MDEIKIYSGIIRYYKGVWAKDAYSRSYVAIDDSSNDSWEFAFESVPAGSLTQLSQYILPKMIQEEKNLSHPVYIDWEEGFLNVNEIGTVPAKSERFLKLV